MTDESASDHDDQETDAAATRPADSPTADRAWSADDVPDLPSDDGRKPLSRALVGFLVVVAFAAVGVGGWLVAERDETIRKAENPPATTTTTSFALPATQPIPPAEPVVPTAAREDAEFLRLEHTLAFVNDDPARAIGIAHQICALLAAPPRPDVIHVARVIAVRVETDYGTPISETDAIGMTSSAQVVYCPETVRG